MDAPSSVEILLVALSDNSVMLQKCKENWNSEGTLSEGTLSEGALSEGTLSEGVLPEGTLAEGRFTLLC